MSPFHCLSSHSYITLAYIPNTHPASPIASLPSPLQQFSKVVLLFLFCFVFWQNFCTISLPSVPGCSICEASTREASGWEGRGGRRSCFVLLWVVEKPACLLRTEREEKEEPTGCGTPDKGDINTPTLEK